MGPCFLAGRAGTGQATPDSLPHAALRRQSAGLTNHSLEPREEMVEYDFIIEEKAMVFGYGQSEAR